MDSASQLVAQIVILLLLAIFIGLVLFFAGVFNVSTIPIKDNVITSSYETIVTGISKPIESNNDKEKNNKEKNDKETNDKEKTTKNGKVEKKKSDDTTIQEPLRSNQNNIISNEVQCYIKSNDPQEVSIILLPVGDDVNILTDLNITVFGNSVSFYDKEKHCVNIKNMKQASTTASVTLTAVPAHAYFSETIIKLSLLQNEKEIHFSMETVLSDTTTTLHLTNDLINTNDGDTLTLTISPIDVDCTLTYSNVSFLVKCAT